MSVLVRSVCGGCGGHGLGQILDVGTSPPANTPSRPERYPLRLVVCHNCWLVQLRDVIADDVLFDDSYTFYSSTSPGVVRYDAQLAHELQLRYPEQSVGTVVEIASNDGSLLRHFVSAGNAVGVDPARGPARKARDRGIPTVIEPFGRTTADQLCDRYGKASLIIGKNVIAHVSNLGDVLSGMASLLADDGVAVLEFQYLGDLIVGNQFDQVYHEHRYFFSLSSLTYIALIHGLYVVDVHQTAPQGGSLRVYLRTKCEPADVHRRVDRLMERERWLRDTAGYMGLQLRAERIRDRLLELLAAERYADRLVAGYGAPAKATTLVNFCGLNADTLHHITDTTPAKQDTFLPGTNIPIVPPSRYPAPDTFLLTAWNYLPEIIRREQKFLAEGGGRFIVSLPTPTVI